MNERKKEFITESQMRKFLIGSSLGAEILYLPNELIKSGKQSSYIFVIIGLIYPVFIVLSANYMCKYYPNQNILKLSKRFLGKLLGTFFNILFLTQFLFYIITRSVQLSNMVQVHVVYFLNTEAIIGIIIVICCYCSYKGIRSIFRVNEIVLFLYLMIFVPAGALTYGSILNLLPAFSIDSSNLIYGIFTSFASYFGIEVILIFYPFMEDKSKVKKAGIEAALFTGIILTWFVFITIYYLGIDIIPDYLWSFIQTTKALRIATIKNFVFIFVFFWTIIVIRSIVNIYYTSIFILENLISRIKREAYSFLLIPIVFILSIKFKNETLIRNMLSMSHYFIIIFNMLFVSVITLLVYKEGKNNGQK